MMLGPAIFGCSGTELSKEEAEFFREFSPFGFIVFARNIETPAKLRKLCADLRACVSHEAPILIDQEGGRVQRLRAPLASEWMPPLDHVSDAGLNAVRSMYLRSRIIAEELRSYGIDANCVPNLDVARPETHPFLKNRCYGFDSSTVIEIGRAVAQGHLDGGVYPVMKHMPGHGRAQLDTHFKLPRVTSDFEALEQDFAPFRALKDLPMGMTAHIVFEAMDGRPSTTSPKVISLIRNDIGFQGLLMTDDISMQALQGSLAERSQAALAAGVDIVLHCSGVLSEMRDIAENLPRMEEEAHLRAVAVLAARPRANPVDIEALRAELEAL